MRRSLIVLAACIEAAACGGHTAAPGTVSAPAPTPSGDPTSVRYTAGTGRYRVEQNQHISQEMMGQTRDIDGSTTMLVSASLTGAGDLAAVFTVDSVAATSSMPGAANVLAQMRGKVYRAVYSPLGHATSFTAPDSGDAAAGEGNVFREFLPSLPGGALAAGTTWTDTSTMSQGGAGGLNIHSQSVRQHRIVGWELHEGVRALRISTTSNYTISGGGHQQGQEMTVAGSGTASVEQFVSGAGVYLGATAADSSNMVVNIVSMGMDVPVRQTRRTAVSRLP
ncbi:MAG: hypothetical protein ACHQU1_00115 [Gemmatimonadales bacterium]